MLNWYYQYILKNFLTAWKVILIMVAEELSLVQIAKTLFSPWRRDTVSLRGSLDQIFRQFVENMISRFFGFIIRSFTILTCLIIEAAILVLGTMIFVLLLIFSPVIFPFTIPAFHRSNDTFSPEARRIISASQNLKQFSNLILKNQDILFIIHHLGAPAETFEDVIAQAENELDLKNIADKALELSKKFHRQQVILPDFFLALFYLSPKIRKFWEELGFSEKDIISVAEWDNALRETINRPSVLFHPEVIRTSGGIGRFWSSGYTPALDRFGYEIAGKAYRQNPLHFETHKETIEEMERILGRFGKHNLILVGEPGIGKKTMMREFAYKVNLGQTLPSLSHHRLIELNIDSLLAASHSTSLESRIITALNEAVRAGNIILLIDNIERLFESPETRAGVIDLSAILAPYLERTDLHLIGITDFTSYHRFIESNNQLAKNLEKIELKEPSSEETLKILQEVASYLESKYHILIFYNSLLEIIKLADKYMGERKFPEKAIDLLDESVSWAANQKHKFLNKEMISKIVASKTHIPIGTVSASEKEKLLNLESYLHRRLINQEEAVRAIAEALRRARSGLGKTNRPIGSFLFLGPTGVGKTECAKTLAETYFGDEKRMVRFDMTEYREAGSIERLIGGVKSGPGLLTSKIRERPFCLILLDEIEKAHPNVLNLLLQILDEGNLTDSSGQPVSFKNTLIIATSNAGSEWIREQIKNGLALNKRDLIDYLLGKGYFRPEFLNRFDATVAFRPLEINELEQVVDLMITRLEKQLAEKRIKIQLAEGTRQKLAEIGFDPQFGARALQRAIQEKVENPLARALLENQLSPGSTYTVTL